MLYLVFKSMISIIDAIQIWIFLDIEFWFIEDWARRTEWSSTARLFLTF